MAIRDILTHVNTRLKLFEKVSLLLVVMLVLASLNIVVIYSYHQEADQVGNSVNIAGQQRMLSQRMVWLSNEVARDDSQDTRNRLQRAVDRYDKNLDALQSGGMVPDEELAPGGASEDSIVLRGERLAPAPPAVSDELDRERELWEEYEGQIRTLLDTEPGTAEFEQSLQYVREHSDQLLSVSDAVTAEFARVIREQRGELTHVLVVLLFVDIGVAAVGALLARRFIGLPINAIARWGRQMADGETAFDEAETIPIDRSLPEHEQRAELSQLARSFDAVQRYHRRVSEQANALADREFTAPVLEDQVPGELGEALDAMQEDLEAYIQELQATTERLDAVIEASPAAILIMDPDGTITRWNPAAESMFGWSSEEVEGQRNPTVPDGQWDQYQQLLSDAVTGKTVTGVEDTRVTQSGEQIDVSISIATVTEADVGLSGIMAVIEDITDRKERERTLRQQRDQLEMLNQVTDLVLRITQELVESSSRERIERTACQTLAASDIYSIAWVSELRHNTGEIRVRTTADGEPDEPVVLDASDSLTESIRTCLDTGDLQVLEADDSVPVGAVDAPPDDIATVAVVPLSHIGTVYGTLVVATERDDAFQSREQSGLATLGKTVGFAINAITNERLLFADTVIDLEFDIGQTELPLVATSDGLDCELALDGFVKETAGEGLSLYLVVDGVDPSTFIEAVLDEPAIQDATVITDDGSATRVEVTVASGSVFHKVVHLEGVLQSLDLTSGGGTLGLEAPPDADIDAIVDVLQSTDESVEFLSKTRRDRPVTTAAEMATMIEDRLTERQYEVFKTAYYGGYFEQPRDSTIEELADNMDISGATFNHHLRHAQRKLADELFATGESP